LPEQRIPLQLVVVDPELVTQTELTEVFLVGTLTLSVAAQKLNLLAAVAVGLIYRIPEMQVIPEAAEVVQV
jgi:hypothetical protein